MVKKKNEEIYEDGLKEDIEDIKDVEEMKMEDALGKINLLEEELKKTKDFYYKALAEMENFKKRINDERIRERKYSSQNLIEKFIEVYDVFDNVVNFETTDEKIKNFLSGFVMLNNSFKQILEEEGVKTIVTKNQIFDPRFHDALEIESHCEIEDNKILQEIRRGYMFKDRVLKASLVKVNKLNKECEQNE